MAVYIFRADVEAEIDGEHLTKFLSDSDTGEETVGLFNKLADSVDAEIMGHISSMPSNIVLALSPYFRHCGKVLFCSLAYRRKGIANESNPFEALAKEVRSRLAEIQKGEITFKQLKTFNYLIPSKSGNKFSKDSGKIENFCGASSSYTFESGELILTAPDGKKYQMVVSYSGGAVIHSWEEV